MGARAGYIQGGLQAALISMKNIKRADIVSEKQIKYKTNFPWHVRFIMWDFTVLNAFTRKLIRPIYQTCSTNPTNLLYFKNHLMQHFNTPNIITLTTLLKILPYRGPRGFQLLAFVKASRYLKLVLFFEHNFSVFTKVNQQYKKIL